MRVGLAVGGLVGGASLKHFHNYHEEQQLLNNSHSKWRKRTISIFSNSPVAIKKGQQSKTWQECKAQQITNI